MDRMPFWLQVHLELLNFDIETVVFIRLGDPLKV